MSGATTPAREATRPDKAQCRAGPAAVMKRIRPSLTIHTELQHQPDPDFKLSAPLQNPLPPVSSSKSPSPTDSSDTQQPFSSWLHLPANSTDTSTAISTARTTPYDRPSKQHTRQRHNHVGQRYRDKLTSEFEALHAVLHEMDYQHGDHDNDDAVDGSAKFVQPNLKSAAAGRANLKRAKVRSGSSCGVNKATILDQARERIVTLLREQERVLAERERLIRERGRDGW
ncbi:hypothetical protein VTI74DRAFT_5130 [Chaetomium olivicolor]